MSCPKRLKLERLPTLGVSDAALSRLLVKLKDEGRLHSSNSVSRRAIGHARVADLPDDEEYGSVFKQVKLKLQTGSAHFTWDAICPFSQLSLFSSRSHAFREIVRQTISRVGVPTPENHGASCGMQTKPVQEIYCHWIWVGKSGACISPFASLGHMPCIMLTCGSRKGCFVPQRFLLCKVASRPFSMSACKCSGAMRET